MAVTTNTSPPPKNMSLDIDIKPTNLSSSTSSSEGDVLKNNRRLCDNCKRTYHRNSLRRHQLLCYKTTSPTIKNLKNNADAIPNLDEINNNSNKNNNNHSISKNDDIDISLEQSPNKRLCLRSAVEANTVVAGFKNGVKIDIAKSLIEKSPSKSKSTTINNNNNNNGDNDSDSDDNNGKRVLRSSSTSPTKATSMEKKEISHANQLFTSNNLNDKSKNKNNGLVCLLCNCKIKDNLEAHFKANHKLDVNSKKNYHCTICDKKFTFDNFIHWYHYKEHHTEEKRFKCNDCSLVFSFVQTLLFHKSVDHLKEMCKSKYCERKKKPEGQQTNNNNNNKSYHLGDRDRDSSYHSSSDVSSSTSTTSASPRSSIDSPSTVSSYYDSDTKSPKSDLDNNNYSQYMFKVKTKCPKDNKKFDSPQEFLEHCRECHIWTKEQLLDPEYEPEFWCPHCGLSFVTPTTLIKHLKTSHEDIICNVNYYMEKLGYLERPLLEHQCPVCYEVLKSSDEYNLHRRVHGLSYLSFLKTSSMS